MSELKALFLKRIGIPENQAITFEMLPSFLEKTAMTIPFENLSLMENRAKEITKENLVNKLLIQKEGGLCYELNSIVYFFLIESGFNAVLSRGVVYNHVAQEFVKLGRTHVTILMTHEEHTYLIDTGFGMNLPLKPVPLSGEAVTSNNGEFRVRKEQSEHGDYVLEMKLRHKDKEWKIGYAFDSTRPVKNVSEFNEIQTIIGEHEDSPFNKNPLITRLTHEGSLILTNTSFTQWINGRSTKEKINNKRFKALSSQHFGI
ncbi:arylamine N-acetyltransferase [Fictibacillus nanhaiensis]|uniref:arylamine N-acetyltransferase family protein n=1 Tax=Fictibacillus nanhaiensis TaxID=742169 RepID=UPI001C97A776|nr:arylamine N-acetyltransferase [Fictibacillus nanhaiensis]MBY6036897.1 arylamine N-acetyltransferase [Fictibacillus nanhaiensis]